MKLRFAALLAQVGSLALLSQGFAAGFHVNIEKVLDTSLSETDAITGPIALPDGTIVLDGQKYRSSESYVHFLNVAGKTLPHARLHTSDRDLTAPVLLSDQKSFIVASSIGNVYTFNSDGVLFSGYFANSTSVVKPVVMKDGSIAVAFNGKDRNSAGVYFCNSDGRPKWSVAHMLRASGEFESLAAFKDGVLAGSSNGKVTFFGSDGRKRWERQTNPAMRIQSIRVLNENLILAGFGGTLLDGSGNVVRKSGGLRLKDTLGRVTFESFATTDGSTFAGPLELANDPNDSFLLFYNADGSIRTQLNYSQLNVSQWTSPVSVPVNLGNGRVLVPARVIRDALDRRHVVLKVINSAGSLVTGPNGRVLEKGLALDSISKFTVLRDGTLVAFGLTRVLGVSDHLGISLVFVDPATLETQITKLENIPDSNSDRTTLVSALGEPIEVSPGVVAVAIRKITDGFLGLNVNASTVVQAFKIQPIK